nr:hypothetical protein A6C57_06990 [Fibrella sp. ES10-3-2-2]
MPRPKKHSEFVVVPINPELKQSLLDLCAEDEVPMSHLVRSLIRREVAARREGAAKEAQAVA